MKEHGKVIFWGCLVILVISATGCFRVAPKMPPPLASQAPINYSTGALDADVAKYRAFVERPDLDAAKTQRNQIAYRIMAQIDSAYGAFEQRLSTRRAGAQTSADAALLGLTAATTLAGTSDIKDILSATATAFQGTRISFDKNFFEQKTTEALVSQMRASRKTLQAQILRSLSNRDVTSYPLESAWSDIISYYYAGTIPSALVDIASKAGNDAVNADQNLKKTTKELTPATPEQAKQSIEIRSEYEKLKKQVASADSAQAAAETIRKILTAAHIPFDSTASPSALLEILNQAKVKAADDDQMLQDLNTAVKSVENQ